jgi:hypothetical protein
MFAAEQARQVAAADGGVAAADNDDNEKGTEHGTGR